MYVENRNPAALIMNEEVCAKKHLTVEGSGDLEPPSAELPGGGALIADAAECCHRKAERCSLLISGEAEPEQCPEAMDVDNERCLPL